MEAQPAEFRIRAGRPPAVRENPDAPAFGVAREQERIGGARTGQRLDERPCGLAERHCAPTGLRVREPDRVFTDVAPAQIEHFAAAAAGEGQQPDRGDRLGPARLGA